MSHHLKKNKISQNIFTWIRLKTSQICYGVKTKDGNPAHCNTNSAVKLHFQALRAGYWSQRLSQLRNKNMADHFAGRKTYYFTADGRSKTPEVLVNLDIDCHRSGSLKGAVSFAEYLKSTRFPNLYYETSTNGKGVHGYIVVVKGDLGDEGLNGALSILDRRLKHELSKGAWDVEAVEVKGQAPEFTWGKEKYELKIYKSGQLAKLPREALARGDELRNTTRIDVDDLRRLKVPVPNVEPSSLVVGEGKNTKKKAPVVSISQFENWESAASNDSPGVKKVVSGSIACRHFSGEELSKLRGSYLSLSRDLLCGEVLIVSGRKVVKEEDLAVFLMLLRFFTFNMNSDGTLPTARWREMWTALYETGDVDRAWCHHRFAQLRNFLSSKDLIAWVDQGYVIGSEHQGRYIPGKAAKWRASEELMAKLNGVVVDSEREENGESILYGCIEAPQATTSPGKIEFVKEVNSHLLTEEGKNILYGCKTFENKFLPKTTRQPTFAEPLFLARLRVNIPPQKPRFAGYSWQTCDMRVAA